LLPLLFRGFQSDAIDPGRIFSLIGRHSTHRQKLTAETLMAGSGCGRP
jgi:hypothetical protein